MAEIRDFSDALVATCSGCNPLAGDSLDFAPPPGGRAMAVWSGRALDDETGVRTWGPAGWARFAAWCDEVAPAFAAAGAELWIRPHAGHVLSDAQRCLTLLREREGGPIGLLLDPVSMLAPSMVADAPDHLGRMFGALARHPRVRALWLPEPGHAGAVGEAGIAALWALVAERWPREKPVVVSGDGGDAQLAILTGAGPMVGGPRRHA